MVDSICGAVELLARIFHADEHLLKAKFGLVKLHPCLHCGILLPLDKRQFCNDQCRHNYYWPLVFCDWCGAALHRRRNELLLYPCQERHGDKGRVFCNCHCFGSWAAHHHGFVAHPENHGHGFKPRHDDEIWMYRLMTGYGCRRLSQMLYISESTVSNSLARLKKKQGESFD